MGSVNYRDDKHLKIVIEMVSENIPVVFDLVLLLLSTIIILPKQNYPLILALNVSKEKTTGYCMYSY